MVEICVLLRCSWCNKCACLCVRMEWIERKLDISLPAHLISLSRSILRGQLLSFIPFASSSLLALSHSLYSYAHLSSANFQSLAQKRKRCAIKSSDSLLLPLRFCLPLFPPHCSLLTRRIASYFVIKHPALLSTSLTDSFILSATTTNPITFFSSHLCLSHFHAATQTTIIINSMWTRQIQNLTTPTCIWIRFLNTNSSRSRSPSPVIRGRPRTPPSRSRSHSPIPKSPRPDRYGNVDRLPRRAQWWEPHCHSHRFPFQCVN